MSATICEALDSAVVMADACIIKPDTDATSANSAAMTMALNFTPPEATEHFPAYGCTRIRSGQYTETLSTYALPYSLPLA